MFEEFSVSLFTLFGEILQEISNCKLLLQLDLYENLLEGEIPQNIYNLSNLVYLDLHHNQLNDSISSTIGNLSNLHFLYLSQNTLSGSIPVALEDLQNLTHFNLSYNLLSGVIPSIKSIQKFGPSVFFHNTDLCGDFFEVSCSVDGTTFAKRKPKLSASVIIAIVTTTVILSDICLITIINMKARRRRRREDRAFVVEKTSLTSTDPNVIIEKLVLFSKTLPSKYKDWEAGTKALLDKESFFGGVTIGSVYKTSFEGGVSITMKKHIETCGDQKNISNNLHLMFIIRVQQFSKLSLAHEARIAYMLII
ncbi:putative LRR receptor-like serine/threonine-protein kinase [Capsicum annuum]|uniref:LRR receptor-like serine/threonine-protein kinase n=1 Tax=Capsicum annuum TaxID=4072 RepID=A0A2G2ZPS9_CAPAN|nr:putative LRR receptor-like serine/threonine-protein kinase [Capsicum annuum]